MAFDQYGGTRDNRADAGGNGFNYDNATTPIMPGQAGAGASAGAAGGGTGPNDWLNNIQQFYKSLSGGLDMNDPAVQNILNGAFSSAGAAANARGIQGPASINSAQQAYMNAAAPMWMQQKQLMAGLLGTGMQGSLGAGNLSLENQALQYQSQLNQYLAQQGQGQGIGSMIGAGLGGLGGFMLGGPMGAAAGVGIGSSLGGGLGGMLGGGGAGGMPQFRGIQ